MEIKSFVQRKSDSHGKKILKGNFLHISPGNITQALLVCKNFEEPLYGNCMDKKAWMDFKPWLEYLFGPLGQTQFTSEKAHEWKA